MQKEQEKQRDVDVPWLGLRQSELGRFLHFNTKICLCVQEKYGRKYKPWWSGTATEFCPHFHLRSPVYFVLANCETVVFIRKETYRHSGMLYKRVGGMGGVRVTENI